jgi:hypothetical protein
MSVVMDMCSLRLVGWYCQSKFDTSIATKALVMALQQRKVPSGHLVHSDRGTQFTIDVFQKQLGDNKFVQNMSRSWFNEWVKNPTVSNTGWLSMNRDLVQSPPKALVSGLSKSGQY